MNKLIPLICISFVTICSALPVTIALPPVGPRMVIAAQTSSYVANTASANKDADIIHSSALTGVSASSKATISFWIKMNTDSDQEDILRSQNTHILLRRNSDNTLRIYMQTSSGVQVLDVTTTGTLTVAAGYVNVQISIDMTQATSGNRIQVYFNGVDVVPSAGTRLLNGSIDWPDTIWALWFANQVNACMSEWYGELVTYLDFSNSANRAKFSSGGHPISLGSDGSTPTGSQPAVYLKGSGANFTVNSGSGGDFSVDVGILTTCGSAP